MRRRGREKERRRGREKERRRGREKERRRGGEKEKRRGREKERKREREKERRRIREEDGVRWSVHQHIPMDDRAPFSTAFAMFSSPTISSRPGRCSSDKLDLSYEEFGERLNISVKEDKSNLNWHAETIKGP